jgi:tetratricopeptide (TPR) repeat protein
MSKARVFISYSHKDKVWKDRLTEHLRGIELQVWSDSEIRAGTRWEEQIRDAVENPAVAILLISADALTSKFLLEQEIPLLVEQKKRRGMVLMPIICRSCFWQEIPSLARLQARPRDGKPLASFKKGQLDAELEKISREIRDLVYDQDNVSEIVAPEDLDARLHQIPSPPKEFVGREAEMSILESALVGESSVRIIGLRGLGGVGKTALALKIAKNLTPSYGDGEIYLDLRGSDPRSLTSSQVMAHVIRSFYPEARIPEELPELAGLYRSVLHGKKAILLLDNARDRVQVEPLIPPPSSLLLWTSRSSFNLPGQFTLDVPLLSEADSASLLLAMAPRVGSAAVELAAFCGGLPLALRLVGSALSNQIGLTPQDYLRRLKSKDALPDLAETTLRLSYELFSHEQQGLWSMLLAFSDTFDVSAAAAVWGLDYNTAKVVLEDLARSSLVEGDGKRYHLHILAQRFASMAIESLDLMTAKKRHAEHFLVILRQAEQLYQAGGESSLQGLMVFDLEWLNISAGQAWAASYLYEDERAAELCDEYPRVGHSLLELRQQPSDYARWLEVGLAASQKRKNKSGEAYHLSRLGGSYENSGDANRAIELYEQALKISREVGDRLQEAETLGALGRVHATLGNWRHSVDSLEQSLRLSRDIGDRRREGDALGGLGEAYSSLGEPRRAIEFFEQHLAVAREMGDLNSEGVALGELGNAYSDLGDPRRAIEFFEQGLAIAREMGTRREEGYSLGRLGKAYLALGDVGRAVALYEHQLAIARELGDRRSEAIASWNLGLGIERQGDLEHAVGFMQSLVDYQQAIGHPDAESSARKIETIRKQLAQRAAGHL